MFYLGIDVSKNTHRFAIFDSEGKRVTRSFTLGNTQEDYRNLLKRLEKLDLSADNTLAGMEATGIFWENLYSFLTEAGYKVIVINPHQTNKFREALRKKAKTDDIDAQVIAILLRSGETAASYVPEEQVQTLREFTKIRYEFIKDRKNYKRQVYALLELVFPEYSRTALKNPFAIGSSAILKRFPTANHLAKAKVKQIEKIVRSIKGNNINIDAIKNIIQMAQDSVYSGKSSQARGLTLKMLLENIQMLNNHIAQLEKQMDEILSPSTDDDIDSFPGANLLNIPGIGNKTVAAMLSAVGFEGKTFQSGTKLIGHVGFFPKIHESGESHRKNKISKRGPKYLRWALYMAAVASIRHNKEMRSLYLKKLSQGKKKKQALIAVAKKLAHIMLSMLKTGEQYKPERVFVTA